MWQDQKSPAPTRGVSLRIKWMSDFDIDQHWAGNSVEGPAGRGPASR